MMAKTLDKKIWIGTVVMALLIVAISWLYMSRSHDKPTTNQPTAAMHTGNEAVSSATMLYDDYLPTQIDTIKAVGDRQDVEPAIVQAARSLKDYFDPTYFNKLMGDYMQEYQDTGKLAQDKIACTLTPTTTHTEKLASTSGNSAIIDTTINQQDGAPVLAHVSVSLETLKIAGVNCK